MTEQERETLRALLAEVEDWLGRAREAVNWTPPEAEQPDTIPAPPVRTTWRTVGLAYRRHYLEAKDGAVLDYHIQHRQQEWEDLARIVDDYEHPMQALETALGHFFANPWVRTTDYMPRNLVKDFGKYYSPPVIEPKDEPDPEAINERRLRERRQEQQRELEARFRRDEQATCAPPPLDELVNKIGRKL